MPQRQHRDELHCCHLGCAIAVAVIGCHVWARLLRISAVHVIWSGAGALGQFSTLGSDSESLALFCHYGGGVGADVWYLPFDFPFLAAFLDLLIWHDSSASWSFHLFKLDFSRIARAYSRFVSSIEIYGFCINQSKSTRPITWVTIQIIETLSCDAESPIFPLQPSLLPWHQAPLSLQPLPEWKALWRPPPLPWPRGAVQHYTIT